MKKEKEKKYIYEITPKRSSSEAYVLLKRKPYVCDLTSQLLLTQAGRCPHICRGVSIDTFLRHP